MEREEFFKNLGFECVGAEIEGIFENSEVISRKNVDYEIYLYVNWKNKRVVIDGGDCSEPIFIKGDWLSGEKEKYQEYENAFERSIIGGRI